jgi:hypothetical protein
MDQNSELPSAADFTRIEGQLFERIDARHRRRVLRHRLVAVAAVLVVAGAGIAAGTIASPTQQSKFAYCYDGSTTSARVTQLALPGQAKSESIPGSGDPKTRVANALFICEAAWKAGIFNRTNAPGPFPVPHLQVCLRNDLTVSVFRKPNSDESADAFCNGLGLSAP